MKRVILLLSSLGTLCLCLLTLVSVPAAHAGVRTLSKCSPTVSSSLGYVSGMAYASYLDVTAIATARVDPNFLAYLGCDTDRTNATNQRAATDLGPLGSMGVCQAVVTASKDGENITIKQSGHIGDISLFGGLLKVKGIDATVTTKVTSNGPVSTNDSVFSGVLVADVPILKIGPNTGVTIPGVGSVTLNKEVTNSTSTDKSDLSVNALDIQILKDNPFGLPVGAHLVLGHAEGHYGRVIPPMLSSSMAYAFDVTSEASIVSPLVSGPWELVHVGNEGGQAKGSFARLELPPLVSVGTLSFTVDGKPTPGATEANGSGSLGGVSLLNGLISVGAVNSQAHATYIGGVPSVTASSGLAQITIAGKAIAADPPANTKIEVPGLGSLTLNEQNIVKNESVAGVEMNMLDLVVGTANTWGLPIGLRVTIGHIQVYAYNAQAGSTASPTAIGSTPMPTVTSSTPTPTPCIKPRPAQHNKK